ncbi:MAG: cytidylyltransferase family protein [Desulfurococcaceae archaeon]|jgi:FAD synthetase|nr:cytidylyltransferase family protein [Desulfurococcaceae archaeon]
MESSLVERIGVYIKNVEVFIEEAVKSGIPREALYVFNLAKDYLSDAKYYYERGDYVTSLSCIAYAEGLLDALRFLGFIKATWRSPVELVKRPRVLVTGSFEFIHPGHIVLLRYAWQMGSVHVIVSRDVNFEKFKGRKPIMSENDRLEVVKSIKYVTTAVLGETQDLFKPIEEIKPDIILLGPDQWIEPRVLEEKLRERGLRDIKIIKFPERIGAWSSTSILSELKRKLCEENTYSTYSRGSLGV